MYYKKLNFLGFGVVLLFLATSAFANISISVEGRLKTYRNGFYYVQTDDKSILKIQKSKISRPLRSQFKKIGQSIKLNIPVSAVVFPKNKVRRKAASNANSNHKSQRTNKKQKRSRR